MQSKSRDHDLIELGESRKEIEIAKVMIRCGDSVDFITEKTGLSAEVVAGLAKDLKSK